MVNFPLHSFDMSPHLARGVNEVNNTTSNNVLNVVGGSAFNRPSPWRKSRPGDSRSSTLSSRENRDTRYDLYAVCYHQGDTLETGHYTAACKNPYDRQWYKFDDQRVTKVSSDALPDEIVNNEAYMLFYQRRTENAECSGSSSNSSDHWVSRITPAQVAPITSTTTVQHNVEKAMKSEVINEKSSNSESLEPEIKKPDSKEIHKIIQEDEIANEAEIAQTEKKQLLPTPAAIEATKISAQINTVESNLDALEKLLDYADADADADVDVINEEINILEKLDNVEIRENKNSNKETLILKEDSHPDAQSKDCVDNELETASNQMTVFNGFDKNEVSNSIEIMNGHANNTNSKQKTPTTSVSSSLSSLSSQSHESNSLAASKHAANNLQNKFNGLLQSTVVEADTEPPPSNEKEHLLSSSLKSNSSSIIGSALTGQFSTYRQPWHGSRSSVSAVEPSTATGAQTSSLHLRHSFSTASNYRLRECGDTLSSVLRNSVNTCSKDTLIFLDQQQHHHHGSHRHHHHHGLMEDEDDSSFMGSRSLWISPVTPHKLITVSPKN